jgi:hypothetical protein
MIMAASAMLALVACGEAADRPAATATDRDGGVVNLYTARHYDSDLALYDQFTAATGIQINRIEGNADQLLARMQAEGETSPADVFFAASPSSSCESLSPKSLSASAASSSSSEAVAAAVVVVFGFFVAAASPQSKSPRSSSASDSWRFFFDAVAAAVAAAALALSLRPAAAWRLVATASPRSSES